MSDTPDEPTRPIEEVGSAAPAEPAESSTSSVSSTSGAEAPPTAAEGASPAAAVPPQAPPPAAPAPPGGFGRFIRHRATQLVAVGVIGLLIGGGGMALIDSGASPHDRGGNHAFDHQRGNRFPDRQGGERGQSPQHPRQPGAGA